MFGQYTGIKTLFSCPVASREAGSQPLGLGSLSLGVDVE